MSEHGRTGGAIDTAEGTIGIGASEFEDGGERRAANSERPTSNAQRSTSNEMPAAAGRPGRDHRPWRPAEIGMLLSLLVTEDEQLEYCADRLDRTLAGVEAEYERLVSGRSPCPPEYHGLVVELQKRCAARRKVRTLQPPTHSQASDVELAAVISRDQIAIVRALGEALRLLRLVAATSLSLGDTQFADVEMALSIGGHDGKAGAYAVLQLAKAIQERRAAVARQSDGVRITDAQAAGFLGRVVSASLGVTAAYATDFGVECEPPGPLAPADARDAAASETARSERAMQDL